jgi:hypothetical protein
MWEKQDTWLHYLKNIMAADIGSAIFLAIYLRQNNITKNYVSALEVIDLQKYKVIKQKNKVKAALNDALGTPFIFFVGKN